MDKTQTPPGRDGGDQDAGKKQIHLGREHMMKAKDVAKSAEKELNKAMDNAHKNKARKMYELADQLSKVDAGKLNEQQLADRASMIKRLGEELKAMKEAPAIPPGSLDTTEQDPDVPSDEPAQERSGNINTYKLAEIMGIEARDLRAAIARSQRGSMTRRDVMTLSNAFVSLLKADDRTVQAVANIIKAGNAPATQEGVINLPPKKMDIPAYKRKEQGGDWKTSTQDLEQDKLRNISSSEWLKKQREEEGKIKEQAQARVSKVFDFSDFKG